MSQISPVTANLPLRDIHLPPEIGYWPPAPGWWLLLATAILCGLALLLLIRFRQRRRLRRLALCQLDDLSGLEAGELATVLSRLLRQAAICHFPRHEVAGLQGPDWLAFLDRPFQRRSKDQRPFTEGAGRVLADAPYRPDAAVEPAPLMALCRQWLKKLPPQPLSFWRGR